MRAKTLGIKRQLELEQKRLGVGGCATVRDGHRAAGEKAQGTKLPLFPRKSSCAYLPAAA